MAFCPVCVADFRHHFVIVAQHRSRWRGKSFDAEQALANVGAALAREIGASVAERDGLARLSQAFSLKSERQGEAQAGGVAPPLSMPGEGERWRFHVGVRDEAGPERLQAFEAAALAGVRAVGTFLAVDLARE